MENQGQTGHDTILANRYRNFIAMTLPYDVDFNSGKLWPWPMTYTDAKIIKIETYSLCC